MDIKNTDLGRRVQMHGDVTVFYTGDGLKGDNRVTKEGRQEAGTLHTQDRAVSGTSLMSVKEPLDLVTAKHSRERQGEAKHRSWSKLRRPSLGCCCFSAGKALKPPDPSFLLFTMTTFLRQSHDV